VRIDLHTHSTASDGTDTPAELVRAAAAQGLDAVALTDHDTFKGLPEADGAAEEVGIQLIHGVEISAVAEDIPFHLLAYFCSSDHEPLNAELALNVDDRVPRAMEITRRLAAAGLPISWEAVMAHVPEGATVGRPHLADTLVDAGAVADRTEAFERYLKDGTPYVVGHHYVQHLEALTLVREAGGVAVFAHPGAHKRGQVVPIPVIEQMAEAGLAGLEVDHPDHDDATRTTYRALAERLGLLVTGSSDYHGTGKPQGLAAETTDPEVLIALGDLAGRLAVPDSDVAPAQFHPIPGVPGL
jgi:predicted metal-dependent phosphoesterase TrpH